VDKVIGKVTSIAVETGGLGYTQAESKNSLTVDAPNGGITAIATMVIDSNGTVTSITVDTSGAGYTVVPKVTIKPPAAPGGVGAMAKATIDGIAAAAKEAVPSKYEVMALQVPILTMIPIPFIRVEEMTLDFNAKIDTVESTTIDGTLDYSEELSEGGGRLLIASSMWVSISRQPCH
jgi:hypothetical protein